METEHSPSFSKEELARYARHFAIPDFGGSAQHKLRESSVLVVGAGGLGSPVLLYLAAAGVGRIGIVDYDRVDLSNLQRQVLYTVADIGQLKVEVARRRLLAMNPHLDVQIYSQALTRDNALEIFRDYDIVADGTDNFPTRYLVNDACVLSDTVNVYASIFRFEGQVAVFNYPEADGSRGPNYRDLYPEPPPPEMVPNCAEGGVLGVLPGIIGSLQASEVIKVITGVGQPLSGRLFLFDAAEFTTRVLSFSSRHDTAITELVDYEQFCGLKDSDLDDVPSIDAATLQARLTGEDNIQLIDVREPYEYEAANLGGTLIPLAELPNAFDRLDKSRPIIVHCQSGRRSAQAVRLLKAAGFEEVCHLAGGLEQWKREMV